MHSGRPTACRFLGSGRPTASRFIAQHVQMRIPKLPQRVDQLSFPVGPTSPLPNEFPPLPSNLPLHRIGCRTSLILTWRCSGFHPSPLGSNEQCKISQPARCNDKSKPRFPCRSLAPGWARQGTSSGPQAIRLRNAAGCGRWSGAVSRTEVHATRGHGQSRSRFNTWTSLFPRHRRDGSFDRTLEGADKA